MNTILLYLFVEIWALFFMHLAMNKEKKYNKLFLIFSFLPLFILLTFRNINVGVDTERYYQAFYRINNNTLTLSDRNWLGLGYVYIAKIIGFIFNNNFIVFNGIIASLTLLFFYKGLIKNCKYPTIGLFILFATCLYYQCFNQSRQMLAIAIVFYSFYFIKEQKFKKFLLYILLAASIHKSALIMIPFYFICKLNLNKKNILIYMIISVVFIFIGPFFIKVISSTSYGNIYSTTGYFESAKSSYLNLIVRLLLLIGSMIFSKKILQSENDYKIFYNLIIWCTLFQILTLNIYIFGRLTTYFFTAYIIIIPKIIEQFKKRKENQFAVLVVVLLLFSAYQYVYYKNTAVNSGYDKYEFIQNNY